MTTRTAVLPSTGMDDFSHALALVRTPPRLTGGRLATVGVVLLGIASLAILPIPLFLTALVVLAARRALALADGRRELRPAAPGAYVRTALFLAPLHGSIAVLVAAFALAATTDDPASPLIGVLFAVGLLAVLVSALVWWPAVGHLILLSVDQPYSLAELSREAHRARAGQPATLGLTMLVHALPLAAAPPLLAIGALLPLSFLAHTLLAFLAAGAAGLAPVFQAIRLRRAQHEALGQP